MAPLVTTPRLLAAGRVAEVTRALHAAWTETSSDPRKQTLDARRAAECRFREEIVAGDGVAISRLATRWDAWRDQLTYNGEDFDDQTLAGKAYDLEVVNHRLQIAGAVPPDERRLLEIEYAQLGDPEPVDRSPRVLAAGTPVAAIGSLVLALLLRHARGRGGYYPSMLVHVDARLASVIAGPDGGAGSFAVQLAPPADPALDEHLRLTGELVLGAHGWPLALALEGSFDRRITSRSDTTVQRGRTTVRVAWTYS